MSFFCTQLFLIFNFSRRDPFGAISNFKNAIVKTSRIILVSVGLLICILLLGSARFTDDPKRSGSQDNPPLVISSKQMDANSISTWYRNNGSFNRDPATGNSGFRWPKTTYTFARYASGMWIGAVVGNDTLVAIVEYDYEYLPGYIDNYGNPQGVDDSLYRIYKINKGDVTSYDYTHWPFNQGAYADSLGKPFMMGDQMMFYSYTDGYPGAHGNNAGSTPPLKAQILQTNWCFVKDYSPLGNIILTEQRIINRGNLPWNKCYFALWSDDDVGDANDDAGGCDTNLNLAYTYNFDNNDPNYGLSPPAVGFQILRGPLVASPGDTARFFNPPLSNNLVEKPGYSFVGMSCFNLYYNSDPFYGDPSNFRETYMNMEGKTRRGLNWVNPATMQPTNFPFSGDPESGAGWIEVNNGGRRWLQAMGPCTVNPGDTQSIVTAQIIARGANNRNSVSLLKNYSRSLKNLFANNFNISIKTVNPVVTTYSTGNGSISLFWNDSCEKISYANPVSGGTYKFQGYNVYRIRPNNVSPSKSDTILIKTFDIVDGVTDILDSVYLEEYQGIVYGVVQKGSDNGIARSIELSKDTVSGGDFKIGSEYKFSVTAYYYDPSGSINSFPKLLSSSVSENIVKAVPQQQAPETQVSYQYGDTLDTDQKDLAVSPVIVEPLGLVNAKYTSTFGGTGAMLRWTLTKTQNGITTKALENIYDFSGGQDTARVYDGMMLIHSIVKDSGIIADPNPAYTSSYNLYQARYFKSNIKGWTYEPESNLWFEGPDTEAVKTAKVITNRQYQSRSMGMSFPTGGTFRNTRSRVIANKPFFTPVAGQNAILSGGPLRKIKIVFGQSSKAYRYVPLDTNLSNASYADMIDIPFSVFAVDELDSTAGAPRQLNTAFLDKDSNSLWDPDTSALGNYHFTYILASDYDPVPSEFYISKNPGSNSPTLGFPSMDVMYVWQPRAKRSSQGIPMAFTAGDVLTVWPYRITKPEFVPGYPIKYSWEVTGTTVSSSSITSAEIASINVFPNPYYGTSELEYDSGGEKFIYFSNLPLQSKIYIYTLDGILVKRIDRDNSDPNSSLQKWDLKNGDGSYVASGMYIVFVDCGSAGAKTLKIAVFKSN